MSEDALTELVTGLVRRPSPAGSERPVGAWLAGWAADRWPQIDWRLDPFDETRANVVARAASGTAPSLLFYSHLDTSLSGDPRWDGPLIGPVPPPGVEVAAGIVSGPGVAVAKGPAAAATVGFAEAVDQARRAGRSYDLTLLLASGGTHRALPPGTDLDARAPATGAGHGVRRYLAGARPAAAVVAKAGPPGVLYEEPGAAYFVVRITGPSAPVMSRADALTDAGVPGSAGIAVEAVERWRRAYLRRPRPAVSQVGREAAVGALRCGLPYKADLVGGVLELYVYAVTGFEDDPAGLSDDLRQHVAGALDRHRRAYAVAVEVLDATPAARSEPDSRIARAATSAWRSVMGAPPPVITGWTGSTDGVVLRRAGVDTVRLGPAPLPAPPGREALRLCDLRSYAALYARLAHAWVTSA